jgi:hypothetical protein
MDELRKMWNSDKEAVDRQSVDLSNIIVLAKKRKIQTIRTHVLNLSILVTSLLGIAAFFRYVANFQELLGQIGSGLMMGGLALRIVIEIISVYKSFKIDLSREALKTTSEALNFFDFRKKIHGPVSLSLIGLYTIGFYMLTPEFSRFFSIEVMVLIDGFYVAYMLVLFRLMHRANRKEIKSLEEIIQLQAEMKEDGSENEWVLKQ